MRTAQSGGFVAVIGCAVLIETTGLHLVLSAKHPWLAWTLTLSSMWALWWIMADQRALGRTTLTLTDTTIDVVVGKRLMLRTERAALASVERPRLMSVSGPPKGYLNATKPAAPNVLLVFRSPIAATVVGMSRPVTQLALRLDAPDELMALCAGPRMPSERTR